MSKYQVLLSVDEEILLRVKEVDELSEAKSFIDSKKLENPSEIYFITTVSFGV